nr:MAG TPA: hypothetical protein [Caudoviricetes sp.]
MKKQRKEIRLKRKRLKAEYNAALRENRRLNKKLSLEAMKYDRKEIRTLAAREVIQLQDVIEMGENRMVEIAKDMLVREICEKLKEDGAIQFEKDYSPIHNRFIVDARVKIVMP